MSIFIPLPVGTIWQGRYKSVEDPNSVAADKHLLGRGGMGAVYLAYDEQLHCELAVKQTYETDATIINAFRKEAQLLANLSHPALPRVSGLFTEHSSYFLVMELIRGDNLLETMNKAGGKLSFETVLNVVLQLLDALDYLHTQKTPVIHKDIKPENQTNCTRTIKAARFWIGKRQRGIDDRTRQQHSQREHARLRFARTRRGYADRRAERFVFSRCDALRSRLR